LHYKLGRLIVGGRFDVDHASRPVGRKLRDFKGWVKGVSGVNCEKES
jgi:hypothetical protein